MTILEKSQKMNIFGILLPYAQIRKNGKSTKKEKKCLCSFENSCDIWTDKHRLVLVLILYAANFSQIHAQQKRRNHKDRHVILSISCRVGLKG